MAVNDEEIGFVKLLSARELATSPFPELPIRLSQRLSSTMTHAVTPRTFSDLKQWPNFLRDAREHTNTLDSQRQRYFPPTSLEPLEPCSDEVGIRAPIQSILFPLLESMAITLGVPFRYRSGGSGRSYSHSDLVILDSSVPQGNELSARVYGNGEAKGPRQWKVPPSQQLDVALVDSKNRKKSVEPIQQMYGDMILDESRYGFLTNYNQTIFFRREVIVGEKKLEFSPVISIQDAPVEAFLFVLVQAYQDRAVKHRLQRERVPVTPTGGYNLTFLSTLPPVSSSERVIRRPSNIITVKATKKRRIGAVRGFLEVNLSDFGISVFDLDQLAQLPEYDLQEIGITSWVIGMGKFGNVVKGEATNGLPLAIKMFDLRIREAAQAFVHEQKVYKKLRDLQGQCIPIVYAVGRIPHCNVVYLALSDEGKCHLGSSLVTRNQKVKVMSALESIHSYGILHNDLKQSHVLLCGGMPKFIDFEGSSMEVSDTEDFGNEIQCMRSLLEA